MPDGTEGSVEQHVRKILAQIGALKARLRAQEQALQSGSDDAVEIDREDGNPGGIHNTQRPA
jgi:outer membrane protein TolC